MGRRLRMTVELGDWLTELGESEPAIAAEVGAALVAVLDAAEPSGLAISSSLTTPYSRDPRESADYLYHQMLDELQHLRRRAAELATPRKRAELRFREQRDPAADPAEVAELEHERAEAQRREAPLTELSLRLQWDAEVFRAAKESGKAMYAIAEAQLRTAGAMAALEGRGPSADATQLTAALKDAKERVERVNAQGLETLHQIRDQVGQADDGRSNEPADKRPEPTRPLAPRPPQPPEPPHPEAPQPQTPGPPQPPEPPHPEAPQPQTPGPPQPPEPPHPEAPQPQTPGPPQPPHLAQPGPPID